MTPNDIYSSLAHKVKRLVAMGVGPQDLVDGLLLVAASLAVDRKCPREIYLDHATQLFDVVARKSADVMVPPTKEIGAAELVLHDILDETMKEPP